jgi:hypothetical protein
VAPLRSFGVLTGGFQSTQGIQSIFKSFFFFKAALRVEQFSCTGDNGFFCSAWATNWGLMRLLVSKMAALYALFQSVEFAHGGNGVSITKLQTE